MTYRTMASIVMWDGHKGYSQGTDAKSRELCAPLMRRSAPRLCVCVCMCSVHVHVRVAFASIVWWVVFVWRWCYKFPARNLCCTHSRHPFAARFSLFVLILGRVCMAAKGAAVRSQTATNVRTQQPGVWWTLWTSRARSSSL